jgi:hypothetical protein
MHVLLRSVRTDDEGVASTLGTTMALLVFLTFMSLIVNQYVPAWMRESEASHVNTVLGQFGGLKEAIDLQILAAHSAANAGHAYIPVTATTAVSLGVDGIPIFAASTPATLTAIGSNAAFSVTFDYAVRGTRQRVVQISNGSIEINVENRYFTPQRIAYENGAIIRYQSDGQIIRGPPTFSVRNINNALDMTFGLVSLFGVGTVTGTSTEVINSQLFAVDAQEYTAFPSDSRIWVNHTSPYGLAWYQFLNETLASSLWSPGWTGTFIQTSLDVSFTAQYLGKTVYIVSARYDPTTSQYTTRLEIRNNVGVLSFGTFRLLIANVNVQVGVATVRGP